MWSMSKVYSIVQTILLFICLTMEDQVVFRLALVDSSAVIRTCLCGTVYFCLLVQIPRNEIVGAYSKYIFNVLRNGQTIFHSVWTLLNFYQHIYYMKSTLFSYPHQYFIVLIIVILVHVKCYLHCHLICIYFMVGGTECFFIYLVFINL